HRPAVLPFLPVRHRLTCPRSGWRLIYPSGSFRSRSLRACLRGSGGIGLCAMRFPQSLVRGRLLRRYKRFLADVELDGGEIVTAHCANPGSMLGLQAPGIAAWLSK